MRLIYILNERKMKLNVKCEKEKRKYTYCYTYTLIGCTEYDWSNKNGDDWVSACRNVVVAGVRCVDRGRKTWKECAKEDTDELGLHSEWAVIFTGICQDSYLL